MAIVPRKQFWVSGSFFGSRTNKSWEMDSRTDEKKKKGSEGL
jgi:hypothetical protein